MDWYSPPPPLKTISTVFTSTKFKVKCFPIAELRGHHHRLLDSGLVVGSMFYFVGEDCKVEGGGIEKVGDEVIGGHTNTLFGFEGDTVVEDG